MATDDDDDDDNDDDDDDDSDDNDHSDHPAYLRQFKGNSIRKAKLKESSEV